LGSVEDQDVLEAAYKRDPKPDKAARLEIVKLVALGEKEVQVRELRVSLHEVSTDLLPDMVPKSSAKLETKGQATVPT